MKPMIFGTGFVPFCVNAKTNPVPKITGIHHESGDFCSSVNLASFKAELDVGDFNLMST